MIIKLTEKAFRAIIEKLRYYKKKNKQKDIIIDGLNRKIQKSNSYNDTKNI